MKKLLLFFAMAVLAAACARQEAPVTALPDSIHDNLYRFGVNTNPYEYFATAETPVPAGYKPFYISHYGRHGARSDWSGTTYDHVLELFGKAQEAGVLSEEGQRAYQMVQDINALHNGMNGRLTPRGAREHRQIAGRMYKKYKGVFRSGSRHIRAVSSTVPRCLVSMAAFTGELLSQDPKLDIDWDSGEKIMDFCSSVDPDDVTKEAYVLIEEHAQAYKADTAYFASRVFTDADAGRAVVGSINDLLDGTLAFAAVSGSFDKDQTLIDLFNEEDLAYYAKNISLNLFLRQCNSAEFGDRRMAVPEVEALVDNVIQRADLAISEGNCVADLRFGHDYHLLAFCARIGIKGIGERLNAQEATDWPGWLYSPFAGNVQMIFYRNQAGDVLVKFFINERETSLLTLPDGPYYRWEEVKKAFKHEM